MSSGFEKRLYQYNNNGFFGKWKLDGASLAEAQLGRGAHGRVYAIYHEDVVRYEAAIKLIPIDPEHIFRPEDRTKSDRQRQFILDWERKLVETEIRIMRRLEGESNIAYFQNSEIIEFREDGLNCCDVLICMEKLVPMKKHLSELNLRRGTRLFTLEMLNIWMQISAALRECEKREILHTDIKPSNIFFAPGRNFYKLGDFGTAIEGKTFSTSTYRGTKGYIAPEMYHHLGGDSRADMYSLAMTIYELFNGGRLPGQRGEGNKERDEAWERCMERGEPVPRIPGVPDDINATLQKCLAHNPQKRFANCEDAYHAVKQLYLRYWKQETNGEDRAKSGAGKAKTAAREGGFFSRHGFRLGLAGILLCIVGLLIFLIRIVTA